MNAFPKELAKKVAERWPNIVGGDYVAPSLPGSPLLKHFLEVAYLAAAVPEETRYPKFNLVAVPHETLGTDQLGKVWKFSNPRTFSELRRLSPSVDFKKSAILAEWSEADWRIVGLVDLGTSWSRARIGLQYDYHYPKALFVQIERPGRIKVYQGEYLVAALVDGKLQYTNGIDLHLALHDPVRRGLEELIDKITSPQKERPRDYHSFVFTAHWNIIAAIANSISDEGHGGAVILVPPDTAPPEQDIRIKYQQDSPVLTEAFVRVMNVRNRVIDFVIRAEDGEKTNSFSGNWAQSELELIKAHSDLVEAIRFVARLSGCDGAIVLSEDLRLLGFGAEIRAEFDAQAKLREIVDEMRGTGRAMDVEQFGLRHRSAIKLISKHPDYTAIAVSQDGPISVVWSKDGDINVRKGVSLTNLNMPWA